MIDVGRELELAARRRLRHRPFVEFLYGDTFAILCGLALITIIIVGFLCII